MIEKTKGAMIYLGASWVLWVMFGLSILSLAIMLERAWLYWSIRDDIEKLMRDLGRLLRGGDMEGAKRRLEQSPSAEAAVVVAGLVESDLGVEAAEEAMAGASALQRLKLEKRLAFLGTLGNNAPFIGLLGTVIGIVGAFDAYASATALAPSGGGGAQQLAPQAVMSSISEALVATAIGLLVAIPAVAAFNAFQRIVRNTLANTEALGHVLLAHLKSQPALGANGGITQPRAGENAVARSSRPPPPEGKRRGADEEEKES